jgi:DNA-binding transcriptional LysR family regulator
MILDDTADIAIALIDRIVEKELETLFLFSTELVFCVNRKHRLATRESIDWEDLANERLILMKEDSYQNELIKTAFAERDMEPNVVLYSSQLHTIKNFIDENVGGAFLFRELADSSPELAALHLRDPMTLNIGLIWKRNNRRFREIRQFIDFVKNSGYKKPRQGAPAPAGGGGCLRIPVSARAETGKCA